MPVLGVAVLLGAVGHLMATAIPALGAYGAAAIAIGEGQPFKNILWALLGLAFLRALLRYIEQLANHYVAFHTLALIRDAVYKAMRRLAPTKLEKKDAGDLMSIITTDIELLEVFYAHTLTPVLIALLHSVTIAVFLYKIHPAYAFILLISHLMMGVALPFYTAKRGADVGDIRRKDLSFLNTTVLDTFIGIIPCITYRAAKSRLGLVQDGEERLKSSSEQMQNIATSSQNLARGLILLTIVADLILATATAPLGAVVATVTTLSSFGPTVALSDLASNLLTTFACGRRVIGLLDEAPVTPENFAGENVPGEVLAAEEVSFAYDDTPLLDGLCLDVKKGEILGIHGASGCGKSTLLRLFMRYYDPDHGRITMDGVSLKEITTQNLRQHESFVPQDTYLFRGTIADNLRIGRLDATEEELVSAAKEASIHEFISHLPEGYQTRIDDLANTLSQGERQRLSLARAFLHGGEFLLFDEPTANVDSLNEGMILSSIYRRAKDHAILLVTHKKSTIALATQTLHLRRKGKS